MIRKGDRAMFRDGPHRGQVGQVVSVDGSDVTLKFRADQYLLPFDALIFEPLEPEPPRPHRKTTTETRDDWQTPRVIFDAWRERFAFDLDAAASPENKLCQRYCAPLSVMSVPFESSQKNKGFCGDALSEPWPAGSTVWLNPPFSQARDFAVAAIMNAPRCAAVVVLVPSATDTRYWRSLAEVSDEIWLSQGRIKFVHPDHGEEVGGNPVGSTIFVLRGYSGRPPFVGFFDAATGGARGRFGPEVFGAFQLRI